MSLLLSLVPPSYMVVPIRDLANIQLSTTTFSPKHLTHLSIPNIEEDIIMHTTREKTPVSLKNDSRDSSIISTTLSKPYYKHMEIQNHNTVRNRLATELIMLKVCNVKLSFDIWLVLYMYFILYS